MVCTFFGHHDCSNTNEPRLLEAIKNQIKQGTTQFYVGTHGNFDRMALSCLRSLKQKYPESDILSFLHIFQTIPEFISLTKQFFRKALRRFQSAMQSTIAIVG